MIRNLLIPLFFGLTILVLAVGCDKKPAPAPKKPAPVAAPILQKTTTHPYAYLYGLSGFKYADLAASHAAKLMVVDVDDAELTAQEVASLKSKGSTVFSYLSIGEAEDYRDYWQGWDENKPAFLLPENKEWKGNYRVKFWDKNWQNIIIKKAALIAQMGFDGIYLDIVDGYQVKEVVKAYPGSKAQLRQEMENFVIRISNQTKKINPRFKVIPQNAVELVANSQDDSQPNNNYLRAIDGMGVEDLWYDDDSVAEWTKYDLAMIRLAQAQGKFIIVISYPTDKNKQLDFVNKSLKAGFIPFAGKRSLSKGEGVLPLNKQLPKTIPAAYYRGTY